MKAFVIDDEELSKHYSGMCLKRATAISTRARHVGHGLRLVSAVDMLYNAGHMPWSHIHEERDDETYPLPAEGVHALACV